MAYELEGKDHVDIMNRLIVFRDEVDYLGQEAASLFNRGNITLEEILEIQVRTMERLSASMQVIEYLLRLNEHGDDDGTGV